MSLLTWMKEFYPTPADSLQAQKAPAAHSLKKWQGLTRDNLRKHKVKVDDSSLIDGDNKTQ